MTTKRKVPMTKAGKPDKRYVKSVNAKSKVTGKATSKRTKSRRAKPQIKGYSANPVKLFGVEVKTLEGATGYMSKGGIIDTDFSKAKKYPLFLAEKHANEFFKKNKKFLAHVKVFEFPKR